MIHSRPGRPKAGQGLVNINFSRVLCCSHLQDYPVRILCKKCWWTPGDWTLWLKEWWLLTSQWHFWEVTDCPLIEFNSVQEQIFSGEKKLSKHLSSTQPPLGACIAPPLSTNMWAPSSHYNFDRPAIMQLCGINFTLSLWNQNYTLGKISLENKYLSFRKNGQYSKRLLNFFNGAPIMII